MEILIYKTVLRRASLRSFLLLLLLFGYYNILQRIKEAFTQSINACQWLGFVDVQNNGILLKKKKVCPRERCWKDIEIHDVGLFMDPVVFWTDKMPSNFSVLMAVLMLSDSNFTNQTKETLHDLCKFFLTHLLLIYFFEVRRCAQVESLKAGESYRLSVWDLPCNQMGHFWSGLAVIVSSLVQCESEVHIHETTELHVLV